jgi:hypothetical protein
VRQLLVHSCTAYRLNALNRRYVRIKNIFRDSFLAALILPVEQNAKKTAQFKVHVLSKKLTASVGGMRNVSKILVSTCEGLGHLEDVGVDGRIILKVS